MKWIDLPPVWLAGFIALTYLIGAQDWLAVRPAFTLFGLEFAENRFGRGGGLFIAAGLVLMAAAVIEMGRHNTTVIPHRDADALVQSGIFAYSRNPIYLGDVLVLFGCVILFKAVLALPLVLLFAYIIRQRFILPEEDRLAARFGEAFDDYCELTRRWI